MNDNKIIDSNPLLREANTMVPVYGQLPFIPEKAIGCDIYTDDGRCILDLYGGHAVAALGYSHPKQVKVITEQCSKLLFQSNVVALDIRAKAAEKLVSITPKELTRVFFVNSGAEANENALRMACMVTGRKKILAITHGFHGRTAAAAAITWNADRWYGFKEKPFEVDFIARDDISAAKAMINDDIAAVIFEPVQGVAGGYDLSTQFIQALRKYTKLHGALLIADEVQSGMGRCGKFFAVDVHEVAPDILTSAKSLGGGIPCGAVLCSESVASSFGNGDLGTTFGGGPLAAAAIVATIDIIKEEKLLDNVCNAEIAIRDKCITGPITKIQGKGLLLGLICDRPAVEVRNALLEQNILTGTSSDPNIIRILAPLILKSEHIDNLARALKNITPIKIKESINESF
ncbi:MAG: hypothetical protein CMO97_00685 [Woeseia sp.]|nr:hypothetical protein [Woeseia sp.]|tara:strand:- start:1842 stop:3050 length:1209 start_codon:yes stop_codon:yes gene_type:complete